MSEMRANPDGVSPPTTWRKRLFGISAGVLAIAISSWLTGHRVFALYDARYHQPVFAVAGFAVGVVLLVLSLAPARLIVRLAASRKQMPHPARKRAARPRIDPPFKPK